jgi:magnesium transporter
VAEAALWVDLLDPDEAALRAAWPDRLHPQAIDALLEPTEHDDEPRPRLDSHGTYILGVFLVPVVRADAEVFYQEIDVVFDADAVLTVRKTPDGGPPFPVENVQEACRRVTDAGMIAYHLADEVAEGFLDMVDDLHDELDQLEDDVERVPNEVVRKRLSDLRHDLLRIRRTLAPTRDALRRVVDDRVELDEGEGEVLPREVELHFADAFDKLLRASEGLESAQDLIGSVRDYSLAKISNDQNEVMKRLTVVASLLLVPTFIVGLYGQNFRNMPELRWGPGYGFSWFLIVSTTIAQLVYFRRKHWI